MLYKVLPHTRNERMVPELIPNLAVVKVRGSGGLSPCSDLSSSSNSMSPLPPD